MNCYIIAIWIILSGWFLIYITNCKFRNNHWYDIILLLPILFITATLILLYSVVKQMNILKYTEKF